METMKDFFINIDLFGYSPTLSIRKQLYYQTFFGGILTLIFILTGIATIIFFSLPLFEKDSPSVNLSTDIFPNPNRLDYFNNFEFIIGIQNSDYITEINEKIFQAEGILFKTIVNDSGIFNIRKSILLTSCDKALKNSTNEYLFSKLNLKGYYCISPEEKEELYIKEHWGNDGFSMIQIKFIDCDNSTGNCASKEEVESFLHSADMSFFIINNLVSTKNYKQPFSKTINEKSLKVSESYKVSLIQYIKHIRIENDDNLIITSNHSVNSFCLGDFTSNIVFERDSDTFMSLSIQLDNIIEKFQRKYYKIQDVGAQVGGIINALYMIILIILKFYERNSYFEFLINNFFEIRLEEFQKQIKIKKNKKNLNHKKKESIDSNKHLNQKPTNNTNSPNSNSNTSPTNTNTNLNTTMTIDNKNTKNNNSNKKINISFFDKLFLLKLAPRFSKARKEKIDEIYFKAIDYIMNNLDVITYLRRAHSSDMKSNLLMEDEQKKIFEYITKPILSLSFLGTRYNIHNLPFKIRQKFLSKNTIVGNIDDNIETEENINDLPSSKKKNNKHKK